MSSRRIRKVRGWWHDNSEQVGCAVILVLLCVLAGAFAVAAGGTHFG